MKKFFSSYDELKKQFGLVMKWEYMAYTITTQNAADALYEVVMRTGKHTDQATESRLINEFYREHFDDVDQEAYIFYTLKTIYENHDEDIAGDIIKKCKKYLRDSNFSHYWVSPTTFGRTVEIKRQTAQDLIGGKNDTIVAQTSARWKKIKEEIPLEEMFGNDSHSYNLLHTICNTVELRRYIRRIIQTRILEESTPLSTEEKMEIVEGHKTIGEREFSDKWKELFLSSADFFKYYKVISEYIDKFPDEFDLDMLLMETAFLINRTVETKILSPEENAKKSGLLKACLKNIKDKRKTIISTEDLYSDEAKDTTYTYNSLLEACERISKDGYYLSKQEEEVIWDHLTEDASSLITRNPEDIRVMKLSADDIEFLAQTEGNIAYLIQNKLMLNTMYRKLYNEGKILQLDIIDLVDKKIMKPEEAKQYLQRQDTIEQDTFDYLTEQKILNPQEQLEWFLRGKLSFEQIENLQEEQKNEIAKQLSVQRLVELFKERENEDKASEYIRYVQAFRNLVLKGKSKEERQEIDEKIIEEFDNEIEDETLENLYKSHLISFITLRDWSGPQVISEMMERTEIRPEDAKDMCYKGDFRALYAALGNPNISRSKKMGIFRTSFANMDYDSMPPEQRMMLREARDHCLRLINLLDIKNISTMNREDDENNGEENKIAGEKRYNEYISDPLQRWDLVDLMGNYSYEMLDQGLAIFKFPEYKGGTIVLEKMYKKDKPEYGRATKILNMTIEEFEQIKPDLIINEDIPPFMVNSHPALQGKLTNIVHSTAWGQQFADYFEYNLENERTPEEIGKIDKKIKSILNSRELR